MLELTCHAISSIDISIGGHTIFEIGTNASHIIEYEAAGSKDKARFGLLDDNFVSGG